jgi:hypothetical protein
MSSRGNWFEQNPKKTIIFSLIIALILLTYAAEKILAHINRSQNLVLFTDRRYINLREYPPYLNIQIRPTARELRESDSLANKEYLVRTDGYGFILPGAPHVRPDVSLVFLGGSTTACMYVAEDYRFPVLAGRLLEKETGKKINSYNAGVGGNNSLHSLDILLNKIIPLRPDIVVMHHNINDLFTLLYDKTYWNTNPNKAPIIDFQIYRNLKGGRAVLSLARDTFIPNLHLAFKAATKKLFAPVKDPDDEFAHVRGKEVSFSRAELISEFALNLQTFINICQARKIVPVLMTQPNRFKDNPEDLIRKALKDLETDARITYKEYKGLFDEFNETIREIANKNNILVIDLARLTPPENRYIYDTVHLNDAGCQLAALIISAHLQKVLNK